jgi:hypothetical protein
MRMAQLWLGQGKRDEARNLITPVYGWFTEGFNTSARLHSPKRSLTPIRCLNMITTKCATGIGILRRRFQHSI